MKMDDTDKTIRDGKEIARQVYRDAEVSELMLKFLPLAIEFLERATCGYRKVDSR